LWQRTRPLAAPAPGQLSWFLPATLAVAVASRPYDYNRNSKESPSPIAEQVTPSESSSKFSPKIAVRLKMLDQQQSVQESLDGSDSNDGVRGSLLTGEKAGKFVKTRFVME
jgi:hypothetical protein